MGERCFIGDAGANPIVQPVNGRAADRMRPVPLDIEDEIQICRMGLIADGEGAAGNIVVSTEMFDIGGGETSGWKL